MFFRSSTSGESENLTRRRGVLGAVNTSEAPPSPGGGSAPAELGLTINGGAGATLTPTVTLAFSGSSPVTDVFISNFPDFRDAVLTFRVPRVDALLYTHSHTDHVGRLPKLYKEGFRGKVIATNATLDLIRKALPDNLNLIREEAERDNHLTQNVLVFMFTPEGDIWMQKRPMSKKHFPGLWDISACGGIVKGETPEISVQRELKEEMGFTNEVLFVEKFLNEFPSGSGSLLHRLSHLFIGMTDQKPIVSVEVDAFEHLSYLALKKRIESAPEDFVPSFGLELEKACAAARKMGWIS